MEYSNSENERYRRPVSDMPNRTQCSVAKLFGNRCSGVAKLFADVSLCGIRKEHYTSSGSPRVLLRAGTIAPRAKHPFIS